MSEKHRRGMNLSVEGHEENEHSNIPERRLLRAILERWVMDLLLLKKGPGITERKHLLKYHNPIKYIQDESENLWSLNWVLIQLFDNPKEIRRKLEVLVKKILKGHKIDHLLSMAKTDYAEYNYSDTSISIFNSNPSNTFLHVKKSRKTTLH